MLRLQQCQQFGQFLSSAVDGGEAVVPRSLCGIRQVFRDKPLIRPNGKWDIAVCAARAHILDRDGILIGFQNGSGSFKLGPQIKFPDVEPVEQLLILRENLIVQGLPTIFAEFRGSEATQVQNLRLFHGHDQCRGI